MSALVDYTADVAYLKSIYPDTPEGKRLKARTLSEIASVQALSDACCSEYRKSIPSESQIKADMMFTQLTIRKKKVASLMGRVRSLV